MFAFGLILNGRESYFRDYWNLIDFGIVVVSVLSCALPNVDLSVLKIIRLFRAIRPLRVISKNEGLKVSI
jgi:hypothetical protein